MPRPDKYSLRTLAKSHVNGAITPDPLYTNAQQIAVSPEEEYSFNQWDGIHVVTSYCCGVRAYEGAGVKNPRGDVGMMGVHDCFLIAELVIYGDL